jgi:hypothetical protein
VSVYWSNHDGTVKRIGVCGGTATVLATQQNSGGGMIHLAVDAQNLYWASTDNGAVMQCAKGGCNMSPTPLATGLTSAKDIGIAVDPTYVYWTSAASTMSNSITNTVTKVPIGGGSAFVVATSTGVGAQWTGPWPYGGVAVDATSTYWPAGGPPGSGVWQCAVAGCGTNAARILASPMGGGASIAADATNVYWIESNALLYDLVKCAKSGCGTSPTVLASGQTNTAYVVTDGVSVYWANATVPGTIQKCAVGGCPSPTAVVSTPSWSIHLVAVDGTSAYFAGPGGTLMAVAK